jgi:alkylhydroperoxidase family enzyme
MARLPSVDTATSPDIAATFARIAASRGWVSNLMKALAHAPEGLHRFSAVGHYARYGSDLTELQRELAVVATVRGVPYGWTHHGNLARAIGVTEAQLAAIKAGEAPADFAPAERALLAYVFAFTSFSGVPEAVQDEALRHFSPRQITDIALISAYYLSVGAIVIGLGVEIEPPDVLRTELDWQKRTMEDPRHGSRGG